MVRIRPGKVDYLSDSDTEIVKNSRIDSSKAKFSTPKTPHSSTHQQSPSVRSSERIRQKRSRVFTKRSKKEILDKIPVTKSPGRSWAALQPRRLVNNFLKETHRYNYDPAYTSGEDSSLDDFIDDDNDDNNDDKSEHSTSEESTSSVPERNSKSKCNGNHRSEKTETVDDNEENLNASNRSRPVIPSSDSESSSSDVVPTGVRKRKKRKDSEGGGGVVKKEGKDENREVIRSSDSESSSSDVVPTGVRKRKKRKDLEGGSAVKNEGKDENHEVIPSSDSESSSSDVVPTRLRKRKKTEESNISKNEGKDENREEAEAGKEDIGWKTPSKTMRRLRLKLSDAEDHDNDDLMMITDSKDDDDEDEDDYDDDDDDSDDDDKVRSTERGKEPSVRAVLLQKRRNAKKRLFSELVELRNRKQFASGSSPPAAPSDRMHHCSENG